MRSANVEINNYTVHEVSRKLRCSPAKLYNDFREGNGPRFFKHGRKIRVSHEAIVEFIAQLETKTAEESAK
jgi:Helix-turn-helix domain